MKELLLFLIPLLCMSAHSFAQDTSGTIVFDSTYFHTLTNDHSFELSRNAHAVLGLEYLNKQHWGLRANLSYGSDWIQGSLISTSVTHDNVNAKTRVSANSLVLLPWLGVGATLNPHPSSRADWLLVTSFILTLPQLVPNLTITAPIIKDHFYLGIAQRTDYYVFNTPAKIYTESSAVARIFVYRVGAEIRYSWPLTRGFLEDKRPYIGGSLYWVF